MKAYWRAVLGKAQINRYDDWKYDLSTRRGTDWVSVWPRIQRTREAERKGIEKGIVACAWQRKLSGREEASREDGCAEIGKGVA